MTRSSRRFFLGWLAGVGLGLALAATSVAIEPGAAPDADAEASAAGPDAGADVSAPPPDAVTIIGKVEIARSATDGGRQVQIVDAEQRVLIVDEIGAGGSLAKHAGESVAATGVVSRRKDGREVLQVSSFRPLGG